MAETSITTLFNMPGYTPNIFKTSIIKPSALQKYRFCADAVRANASESLSSSFKLCLFCLSLVRVPESRVNRGSGFLGGGEAYSWGEGLLGRVWFAETLFCLVSGLVHVSRQPSRR